MRACLLTGSIALQEGQKRVLWLRESNPHEENWVSIQELAGSVGGHRGQEFVRGAEQYSHRVHGCR